MPARMPLPVELGNLLGSEVAGRYLVEECVGLGAMAVVFRGRHSDLRREVAIKVLRPEYARHREATARFDREARAASHLEHPHCIQVFDYGRTDDGLRFMVMPFLRGRELSTALGLPLPVSQAVSLAQQVLRGLDYAHSQGIIHRDLKPDNLFVIRDLDGRETLKIVDFGVAKLVDHSAPKVAEVAAGDLDLKTKVGSVVGTPAYISPEQAVGTAEVDHRSDLYSLGVILYEMLTGKLPFTSTDARTMLYKHVTEDPPPIDFPVISSDLSNIVLRLLAKTPSHRFASAAEAHGALQYVAESLAQDPTPWIGLAPPPVEPGSRRPLSGAPSSRPGSGSVPPVDLTEDAELNFEDLPAPPSLDLSVPPPPPPPRRSRPDPSWGQRASAPLARRSVDELTEPMSSFDALSTAPMSPSTEADLLAVDRAVRSILSSPTGEASLNPGLFDQPPEGVEAK